MLAAATGAAAQDLPPEAAGQQFQTAEGYARHALALDPQDAEAYIAAGFAAWNDLGHWQAGYQVMTKAMALEPSNGVVTLTVGERLDQIGRSAEGVVYDRRAAQLDPFNQFIAAQLVLDYGLHGQPEKVGEELALARRRWPGDPSVERVDFLYQAEVGDPALAAAKLHDPHVTLGLPPGREPYFGALIRARRGQGVEDAVALFRKNLASKDPADLMADADALAVLGRPELALEALDRIGDSPIPDVEVLFNSYWAPVRADPRFMRFTTRQGLAAIWKATGHWPDFCAEPGLPYDCRQEVSRLASLGKGRGVP
jgi:hypothetical protein